MHMIIYESRWRLICIYVYIYIYRGTYTYRHGVASICSGYIYVPIAHVWYTWTHTLFLFVYSPKPARPLGAIVWTGTSCKASSTCSFRCCPRPLPGVCRVYTQIYTYTKLDSTFTHVCIAEAGLLGCIYSMIVAARNVSVGHTRVHTWNMHTQSRTYIHRCAHLGYAVLTRRLRAHAACIPLSSWLSKGTGCTFDRSSWSSHGFKAALQR